MDAYHSFLLECFTNEISDSLFILKVASDSINQSGVRMQHRWEWDLMILILMLFFLSLSFFFSLTHPLSRICSHLSSNFNTRECIFVWGQIWDIWDWIIDAFVHTPTMAFLRRLVSTNCLTSLALCTDVVQLWFIRWNYDYIYL